MNSAERRAVMDRMMTMQGGQCFYCEKPMRRDVRARHPDRATIEHRVPVSRGGSDRDGNVVAACRACNTRKGERSEEAFRQSLQSRGGELPSLFGLDYEPPQRSSVSNEEMENWRAILEMLRDRTREVFLLSRVDKLTYEEIAREMRMTTRSVRRHMIRAIGHLDRFRYGD